MGEGCWRGSDGTPSLSIRDAAHRAPHSPKTAQDAPDCEDCCPLLSFACYEKTDHDALVGEGPSDASALRSWRRLKSAARCESAQRATLGSGTTGGRSESGRDNGLRGGFGSEERCGVTISRTSSTPNGANKFSSYGFPLARAVTTSVGCSETLGKRRLRKQTKPRSRVRRRGPLQTGVEERTPVSAGGLRTGLRSRGFTVVVFASAC